MKHYGGLDVSVKETSVGIVDESGNLCRERKVASHPEDLVSILSDPSFSLERVGVDATACGQAERRQHVFGFRAAGIIGVHLRVRPVAPEAISSVVARCMVSITE